MLKHHAHGALTAPEVGIDGKEDEHIGEADHIIHDDGCGVVGDEILAVGSNQAGKEAEETDGRVVGDDLDGLEDAVGDILQKLCRHGLGTAGHLHAEAKEDGRHNQRQDGPAAQQFIEVGLGEEVHDQVGQSQAGGLLRLELGSDREDRQKAHDDIHDQSSDGGSAQEGDDGGAQQFAGALDVLHVGDGGGDGEEHHGHHHAEHHVHEQRSQGLQLSRVGPYGAHDAAGHDTDEHQNQKTISTPE